MRIDRLSIGDDAVRDVRLRVSTPLSGLQSLSNGHNVDDTAAEIRFAKNIVSMYLRVIRAIWKTIRGGSHSAQWAVFFCHSLTGP